MKSEHLPRIAAAAVLAGALALAACSSGTHTSTAATTTSTTTTVASTTTTAPTTTTVASTTTTLPPTTTPSAVAADLARAKQAWEQGATAISVDQDLFYDRAEDDLKDAVEAGATSASYATAVQELKQLATLPDAMLTPAQDAEFKSDTTALNTFFATPGLYL